MCKGNIKTNPRPEEFYCGGTAPPGFEIFGSATVLCKAVMNINSPFGKARWFNNSFCGGGGRIVLVYQCQTEFIFYQ